MHICNMLNLLANDSTGGPGSYNTIHECKKILNKNDRERVEHKIYLKKSSLRP